VFYKFAAIATLLIFLTWPYQGNAQSSLGSIQVSETSDGQPVIRPPAEVGHRPNTAEPNITRTTDPRSRSELPADLRPEIGGATKLPPQFRRALVDYKTSEPPGTIIVDTSNTYLYLVLENGKALRYGIGVGREGFTWAGAERISKMAEWPDWNPPLEMIDRQPDLPRFMAGGEAILSGRGLSISANPCIVFTAQTSPPPLARLFPPAASA
jgi:lipoprotein-anchoring transpeptidase ErfK/SrfK